MTSVTMSMDQGTTLAWTHAYGSPSPRLRAREVLRHAIFALALTAFVSGVAGFVSYEPSGPRYAKAPEARPAL